MLRWACFIVILYFSFSVFILACMLLRTPVSSSEANFPEAFSSFMWQNLSDLSEMLHPQKHLGPLAVIEKKFQGSVLDTGVSAHRGCQRSSLNVLLNTSCSWLCEIDSKITITDSFRTSQGFGHLSKLRRLIGLLLIPSVSAHTSMHI